MDGLSHVALQLALCGAAAKAPPDTPEPVHVRMGYRVGEPEFEKTFVVHAGDGPDAFVEFDIRGGLYRMTVDATKLGCTATRFVRVLPAQNRKIVATLVDGPPAPTRPQMLMEGMAPMSFLYTKPTYVLIDKAVGCDQPVGTPAIAPIDYEYDQGAYYLWMYGDASMATTAPTIALRLRTPTGLKHYVRVPVPYDPIGGAFPPDLRFDMTEDMLDEIATEKTDTLLCPKLWSTSAK
jgi:hypothetical protein